MGNLKPIRVQRKRVKGWRMPANTVNVGRPSKWGNPFRISKEKSVFRLHDEYGEVIGLSLSKEVVQQKATELYREWIEGMIDLVNSQDSQSAFARQKSIVDDLPELKGKNLACWCKEGTPCHADVLLEIANEL